MIKTIHRLRLLLLFSTVAISQVALANFEYKDHMVANLLISDNAMELKVAGKVLEEIEKPNRDLTDLAAVRLFQNFKNNNRQMIDANAWLIRALKQSGYKRYSKLLTEIHSQSDIDKIKKYLDEAIPSLTKGEDNQYIDVENYDYDEIASLLNQSLATETFSYGHIDSVIQGETVKEIYDNLGHPSEITYYIHSKRIPFAGRIKLQDVRLVYQGSGSINLRSLGGDQLAYNTIPEKNPAIGENEIDQVLINANGARTRIIAKDLYRNKDYSEQFLDAAGNKIWLEKNSIDGDMVDAIAWLCKFIGASKNSRYYSFMEKTVNATENKKIKKYAKKYLNLIPKTEQADNTFSPTI